MDNNISKENFAIWKRDPVTIELLSFLKQVRVFLEAGMLDPSVILQDGGIVEYARAVGQRDGIDMVLDIEFEDLIEESEEENGDEETSRTFME